MNYLDVKIFNSKSYKFFNLLDSLLIFMSMFLIILFFKESVFLRLCLSIRTFINNLLVYLNRVFNIQIETEGGLNINDVLTVYGGVDGLNIIPVDFETFKIEFISFFQLFINYRNYIDFFIYILPIISLISKIILMCVPLFILTYMKFKIVF